MRRVIRSTAVTDSNRFVTSRSSTADRVLAPFEAAGVVFAAAAETPGAGVTGEPPSGGSETVNSGALSTFACRGPGSWRLAGWANGTGAEHAAQRPVACGIRIHEAADAREPHPERRAAT